MSSTISRMMDSTSLFGNETSNSLSETGTTFRYPVIAISEYIDLSSLSMVSYVMDVLRAVTNEPPSRRFRICPKFSTSMFL